jgi:MinD-like ATPase involved in chromosome partitioning or flagellar assembly
MAESSAAMIIGLGSGPGGVGRTTLTLEIARVLARRNISHVLVDCALTMPVLADALGRQEGRRENRASLSAPGAKLKNYVQRDPESPTGLLTLADGADDPKRFLATSPARFASRLRKLPDQIVLMDLPAGTEPFWLDLLASSDVPVVISSPEAWSVRATVPFLEAFLSQPHGKSSSSVLRSYLVLNRCRERSEREFGEVLCHALWRKLGHYPRFLGGIDFDDRRWFHHRHTESLPPLASAEGAGASVEALVDRLLDIQEFDQLRPRTENGLGLGVSGKAPSAELRAQYRRLWEGYRRDSAISQTLFDTEKRAAIIEELEQTFRAMQVAVDREGEAGAAAAEEEAEVEAAHCGRFLAGCRRSRGLSREDLSNRTKIGLRYLEAIEEFDIATLPLPVYLRGYLREIARVLEIPVESLLDRYLTELADGKNRRRS